MASRDSRIAAVPEDLRRDNPELADRWEPPLPLEQDSDLHRRQRSDAMAPRIEGRPVGAFRTFAPELPVSAQDQQRLDEYQAHRDELPRVSPREWLDFFSGDRAAMTAAPGASIIALEASRSSRRGQAEASQGAAPKHAPEEQEVDGGTWRANAEEFQRAYGPRMPVKGNKGVAVKALCLEAECM